MYTPRSIPACAGLSSVMRSPRSPAPVHPRVRGALDAGLMHRNPANGPSPRARGSRCGWSVALSIPRSIPACAGLSQQPARPPGGRSVHPRVRGALRLRALPQAPHLGPSPRARGSQPMTCDDAERYLPVMFSEATKTQTSGNEPFSPAPPCACHPGGRRTTPTGFRAVPPPEVLRGSSAQGAYLPSRRPLCVSPPQ